MDIKISQIILLILLIICNGAELIIFSIIDMELPTLIGKPYMSLLNVTVNNENATSRSLYQVWSIETIYASKYIPGMFLTIPAFILASKDYHRGTYIVGWMIHCISGAALSFGNSNIAFISANALSGLAMVFTTAGLPKIFREIFPGDKAYSRLTDFAIETRYTGIALSLWLGPKAYEALNQMERSYVVCSIYLVLTFLLIVMTSGCGLCSTTLTISQKTDDEKSKLTGSASSVADKTGNQPQRQTMTVLLVHLAVSRFASTIVQNTAPWRLQLGLGLTPSQNGNIVALSLYGVSLLSLLIFFFGKTHKRRVGILILTQIFQSAGIILYPWVSDYTLACVSEAFFQTGQFCYMLVASRIFSSLNKNNESGPELPTVQFISMALSSYAATLLFERFAFSLVYWATGGVTLVMALASITLCCTD